MVTEQWQTCVLTNLSVCITGVSPKSLGEALAKSIAKHSPATLILASRTKSKLEEVVRLVQEQSPSIQPKLVVLDLASLKAVRQAAGEILYLVDHIDILINNAGVVSSDRRETADGVEQTFGANHIGHFLCTSLLTPLLLKAAAKSPEAGLTRVVNVTSLGYRLSPIRFHDYNFEGKEVPMEEQPPLKLPSHMTVGKERPYASFPAYGQSKTANILHCVSLNQKLGTKGIRAIAVHPGCRCPRSRRRVMLTGATAIWTDLSRDLTPEDLKLIEGTANDWITQDQGTSTILVAALDPKLAKADGASQVFMADCQVESVEKFANDPEIAERLWQLSEQLTSEKGKL